jgi:hypothetical protein
MSFAPAGFVIRLDRALFYDSCSRRIANPAERALPYDALDYKSTASLKRQKEPSGQTSPRAPYVMSYFIHWDAISIGASQPRIEGVSQAIPQKVKG